MGKEAVIPQNRDANEAAQRVDARDEAVQAQLIVARNYRYAGVLNAMRTAKEQSGTPDFTGEDVDRILRMWNMVDETVTYNDVESIPPGFGSVAQSQHMTTMAKAALNSAELQLKKQHEEEAAAIGRKNGRTKVAAPETPAEN
jgi:hypothetical protein